MDREEGLELSIFILSENRVLWNSDDIILNGHYVISRLISALLRIFIYPYFYTSAYKSVLILSLRLLVSFPKPRKVERRHE